jgi:uncharacterized phosphosugar-binding protein
MKAMEQYIQGIRNILDQVEKTQKDAIDKAAGMLAEATLGGRNIFIFGSNHAGLLALEMYYRTGGMANINPIQAPGLSLDVRPPTLTSRMERLPGYGRIILDAYPIQRGDVLILHSVSGRNNVSIDTAVRARELGAQIIVLTNLNTTKAVASRHPSGKNLYELADLVLDNCGCVGDASLLINGMPQRVGPTSTAIGAVILNAMMVQAVEYVAKQGGIPPVFVSANMDGGDEYNDDVLKAYREHIFYL